MKFRNEYAFLSNMYPSPIIINGLHFTCVESAFQSFKTLDPEIRKQFQSLSGKEAKALGRRIELRDDWNKIRVEIMKGLIRAKFQNPILSEKLIAITEPIVEDNTWNDRFWGKCNGEGQNQLGRILEAERTFRRCLK